MVSKKVTIKNPTGLHLRPARELTQTPKQMQNEEKLNSP